jgi:hypothetical protein
MKRILVGLIALGLAIGLMLSCELNGTPATDLSEYGDGVVEASGTLSGDIILETKDAQGNVLTRFTWGADGTWTYESYDEENDADLLAGAGTDLDNDGTPGDGEWYQDDGYKGTYSYDAATRSLTLEWWGNTYLEINTAGSGFAWTGDWGTQTFNGLSENAAWNINHANNPGSPLPYGTLKQMETVDFSSVFGATPGTYDMTGNLGSYPTATQYLDLSESAYVDGTYTRSLYSYDSGTTAADIKFNLSEAQKTFAVDNAAQTITVGQKYWYTAQGGTKTAVSGYSSVFAWENAYKYVQGDDPSTTEDETVTNPPLGTWYGEATDDVTTVGDIFQVDIISELKDPTTNTVSGSTHTITLGDGDFEVQDPEDGSFDDNWDLSDISVDGLYFDLDDDDEQSSPEPSDDNNSNNTVTWTWTNTAYGFKF